MSNPEKKDKYDKAIAECPNCYTYEVIPVLGTIFRCKYCGCKFNASHPSDIIETIERAAIPEKRKKTINLFQSTQCSWCSKFYTNEPFLCIYNKLQSNCLYFEKLDINMRKKLMGEERWWWRMADMLKTVEDKGMLCKCRMCGSLNPNPQKNNCWNCNKEGLNCPNCTSFLQYSTESNIWKCRNKACNKTYIWVPKKADNVGRTETTGRTKINIKIYILRIYNRTKRFIKKIYHFSTSFFRLVSKVLKSFWNIFKRFIVLFSTLGITAIVLAAVSIFVKSSTIGLAALIIISIIGLILIVFGLLSISKYKLSFAKTFIYILLSVIFAVLSCAYLNIHSVNDIKDSLENLFISEEGQLQKNINEFVGKIGINLIDDTNTTVITVSTTVTSSLNSTVTTKIITSLTSTNKITKEYVYIGGGVVIGADGHKITLINNTEAANPTWGELISFLKTDNTDEIIYDYNSFVCADFAERLHNNAEAAGIKAGYVCVTLGPADYRPTIGGHALNIFETSDRGLVFIDCTGYTSDLPISADKLVEVEVGDDYIPKNIFASNGWYWSSMGEVLSIDVIEW